ncbi:MAG: hypothetical protein NPMRTH1_420010 [Nitrosopumilales archaeon]|nr:MAG: hypothetical protein NPMRTH1_420010 [Nitrosopumilales archaeon]
MVRKRKAVLFIDDGKESKVAIQLFEKAGIAYVTYHIKKLEESCCGEVPTTISPSVFAPDGVFKGFEEVKGYVSSRNNGTFDEESKSAYW